MMKYLFSITPSPLGRLLYLSALLVFPALLQAQSLYWNPDPLSGNWGDPVWATSSGGETLGEWVSGRDAIFDQAGTYAVTLDAPQTANALSVKAGDVTFTGSAGVSAESITIDSGASLTAHGDRFLKAGTTSLTINGALNYEGSANDRHVNVLGGGGSMVVNGAMHTSGNFSFAGNISGTQGLITENAGTYTFAGNNTHGGAIWLRFDTTVRVNSANGLSPNTLMRFGANPVSVELAAGDFIRTVGTGAGQVEFGANGTTTPSVSFAAVNADRQVAIAGAQWGSATFNLNTLILGTAASTHKVELTSGLDLNGATRTVHSVAGTAAVGGEISGTISGAGESFLQKTGTGVLVLSGENTHSGETVIAQSQGSVNPLRVANSAAPGTGTLRIGGGGNNDQARLELIGGVTISNTVANITSRNNEFPHIVNVSGDNTMLSNLSFTGGGAWGALQSDEGSLILAGSLSTPRGMRLQGAGDGVINGNASVLAGYPLVKRGEGTWTLNANFNNVDPTTVEAGALMVNGNGSGATGDVTVMSGATLGGSGSLAGAIALQNGATFAPGAGLGSFTGSDVTWNGGAVMRFDVSSGSSSRKLILTGSLIKGEAGEYILDFGDSGGYGSHTLIEAANLGGFTKADFSYSTEGFPDDAQIELTVTGTKVVLDVTREGGMKTFYVSPTGSDANAGDETAPFRTIQKAASTMLPGDVCIIAEGTYPETVTPASDGVTFRAAPGAEVTVSGYERVTNWTVHQGSIYTAQLTWNLNDQNQVLYNGQMMNLARWPNKTDYNPFNLQALWATGRDNSNSHIGHRDIPDWDWSNGGVVFFLGRVRWTSWRRPITASEAGKVYFETLPLSWDYAGEHCPTKSGEFFLQNILQALDSEGEWYIDRELQKIYFWAPGGGNPANGETLVRRRTTAFNLTGRTGVTIDGLTIMGGQINMSSATDCVVKHCRIYHGNFTIASNSSHNVSQTSINFNADSANNLIYRNDIQWGAANGIRLLGKRNVLDANVIGNFNWLASYACPIFISGEGVKVTRNEVFNAGRDLLRGGWVGAEIGYNHLYRSSLINDDCGAIYFVQSSFGFTRIHHNWIHNLHSVPGHIGAYKSTGIYLDNNTRQVIVDHNVVWDVSWTGIQINWAGEDLLIYNNTLWSNDGEHCKAMGRWALYSMKNVQVYNTLANEGTFHGTDLSNNVVMALDANPFQDFAHRNFTPVAGSAPVDAGRIIPGYTDGFHGSAPDAGAYEFGVPPWTAGPLARMAKPVPNASLTAGQTLMVTISALDEPLDTLVFSLVSPPEGMTIDPSTGVIRWRPTMAQSGMKHTIVVAVTDTGTPPLDTTLSFDVTVAIPEPPEITHAELSDGEFAMVVSGEAGPDYTLQSTTDLLPPVVWLPLQTVIRANPPILLSDPSAAESDRKYYRVILGP